MQLGGIQWFGSHSSAPTKNFNEKRANNTHNANSALSAFMLAEIGLLSADSFPTQNWSHFFLKETRKKDS
jgi:hypothetical protein